MMTTRLFHLGRWKWRKLSHTIPQSSRIMVITVLLVLHLSAVVRAAVTLTNDEYAMLPNEPFTITWEGNRGPITLTLMNGPDEDLQVVMVVASGVPGSKYTWTPPVTLAMDRYNLQIEDGVSTDYSPEFLFPAQAPVSSTSSPTPSATSSPSPGDSSSSTSLSTGAIAGIAVGAGIAGILIFTLLGCFIYKRGKRAGHRTATTVDGGGNPLGYYAPGNDTFDQETMVGSGVGAGSKSVAGTSTTWGGGGRTNTPFAELGQDEYMPREMWAGSVPNNPQGQQQFTQGGYDKAGGLERTYQVPPPVPAVLQGWDEQIQQQQDRQQQQRIADDWHVSPASRSGTGPVGSTAGSYGGYGGGGGPLSPSSTAGSPPMGYSATVTAGGPPSTPGVSEATPGFGRGGSPLSFSSRRYAAQVGPER